MAKIKKNESSSLTNEEKRKLRAAKRETTLTRHFGTRGTGIGLPTGEYYADKYAKSDNKRTTRKGTQPKIPAKKYRAGGNNPTAIFKALKLESRLGVSIPPRSGPSSGGGGQSARYNRLTGGLMKHGR